MRFRKFASPQDTQGKSRLGGACRIFLLYVIVAPLLGMAFFIGMAALGGGAKAIGRIDEDALFGFLFLAYPIGILPAVVVGFVTACLSFLVKKSWQLRLGSVIAAMVFVVMLALLAGSNAFDETDIIFFVSTTVFASFICSGLAVRRGLFRPKPSPSPAAEGEATA